MQATVSHRTSQDRVRSDAQNHLRILLHFYADCPFVVVIKVELIVDQQWEEYEFVKENLMNTWLNQIKWICLNGHVIMLNQRQTDGWAQMVYTQGVFVKITSEYKLITKV
jgi:hypothetical protein